MSTSGSNPPVGIIGGTGLTTLSGLEITAERSVDTPWGQPSSALVEGRLGDQEVVFLSLFAKRVKRRRVVEERWLLEKVIEYSFIVFCIYYRVEYMYLLFICSGVCVCECLC